MDFTFSPEADEAAELAASILRDNTGTERLKAVEAAGDRFDRELWATLSNSFDWADLGLIELCHVLVEVGHTVAPLPLASRNLSGTSRVDHATPATPVPLPPVAAMVPATWVPWPSSS